MRQLIVLAILGCVVALPQVTAAQARRYHVDLTLEPQPPAAVTGMPGAANGLQVILPDHGGSLTLFGLGVGIGGLVTRLVEVGTMMNLTFASGDNVDGTEFGFRPFLKLNIWATPHINPFFQPFAGFLILSNGESWTLFDGGLFVGADLLVTSWGIRLYTGFEAVANDNGHVFAVPFHWALVAYF